MGRYDLLKGIPSRGKLIEELNLYCTVKPLERPRKGRDGHFYTPRTNQLELYKQVSWYIPKLPKIYKTITCPVIVDHFIFFSFQDEMYPVAKKYGDKDNLEKALNDALSPHSYLIDKGMMKGKILQDDSLIIGGECFKLFDIPEEGTTENYAVVRIYKPEGI